MWLGDAFFDNWKDIATVLVMGVLELSFVLFIVVSVVS